MTYSPTTIARHYAQVVHEAYCQYPGNPVRRDNETVLAILTAAARMVAESGAVDAMTEASEWLAELADDGDSADWCLKKHAEIATCLKTRAAALANLAKLEGRG